jgi:hypothetical protein
MSILLDECVPWPMHKLLSAHSCSTVQDEGWGGIKNGDLLQRAEGEFDLFITSDQISATNRTSLAEALQFSNSQPMTLVASKRPAR